MLRDDEDRMRKNIVLSCLIVFFSRLSDSIIRGKKTIEKKSSQKISFFKASIVYTYVKHQLIVDIDQTVMMILLVKVAVNI